MDTDLLTTLRSLFACGEPFGPEFGMTADLREALYAAGHALYAQGQYQQARSLFAQLVLYDHTDPRYIKALAAATQMLAEHELALQMYTVIAAMNPGEPQSVMHAGTCMLAMGRRSDAAEAFELAISLCHDVSQGAVRSHCQRQVELLRRERE
ncbi:SycD/LcrH family type III secretion system chaperone [Bordetella flabilis]|uniref:SycD/LcrH family type III secretion system chaperone n=1 Tax=Bordetella flabilis TaxID=463014 RepID=UPI0018DCCA28|nr:SycD/LcrH family type III secretion system chaperone [Bordetella flabilis]